MLTLNRFGHILVVDPAPAVAGRSRAPFPFERHGDPRDDAPARNRPREHRPTASPRFFELLEKSPDPGPREPYSRSTPYSMMPRGKGLQPRQSRTGIALSGVSAVAGCHFSRNSIPLRSETELDGNAGLTRQFGHAAGWRPIADQIPRVNMRLNLMTA